jgi:hypothetical protein
MPPAAAGSVGSATGAERAAPCRRIHRRAAARQNTTHGWLSGPKKRKGRRLSSLNRSRLVPISLPEELVAAISVRLGGLAELTFRFCSLISFGFVLPKMAPARKHWYDTSILHISTVCSSSWKLLDLSKGYRLPIRGIRTLYEYKTKPLLFVLLTRAFQSAAWARF